MHKRNTIKDFFTFSKGERNGIIFLSVLIILLIFAPLFISKFFRNIPDEDRMFLTQVDSFFDALEPNSHVDVHASDGLIENEEIPTHKKKSLFEFDPNTIRFDELLDLGLSPKQARTVLNYRNKGGKFRVPEDFAKIYTIEKETYNKLRPWIKIESLSDSRNDENVKPKTESFKKNKVYVELNSADTSDLMRIKGIGKVYACRIIDYRNRLGGYYSFDQLKEVWGMPPDVISLISDQVWIDSLKIQKINLNSVTFEELMKNPYLNEYQAKAVIYFRNKVGLIKEPGELVVNKILPDDKFLKLKRYLFAN